MHTVTFSIKSQARGDIIVTTNEPLPLESKVLDTWDEARKSGQLQSVQTRIKQELDDLREENPEAWLPVVEPVPNGDSWRMRLLEERVAAKGGVFRVERFTLTPETLGSWSFQGSSYGYSELGSAGISVTKIMVRDANGEFVDWDTFPSYLGIEVQNSTKVTKRLHELVREALFSDYSEDTMPRIHCVEFSPEKEKAVDGLQAISVSFALRMAGQIPNEETGRRLIKAIKTGALVRVNYRMLSPLGLIKGDAIIVPDAQLKRQHGVEADLYTPSINGEMVNLKSEIRTTDWFIQTMEPHHAHGEAWTNDQLLGLLSEQGKWFFDAELLKEDLTSYIEEFKAELASGEGIPSRLIGFTEGDFGEPGEDKLRNLLGDMSNRWTLSGMRMQESSSMMGRVGRGLAEKLAASYFPKVGKAKIRMPIRHAAYLYVATQSILESICGYDLEWNGYDKSKSFYHQATHSWVNPDDQFIASYDRHGGWDLDDSVIVALRNFVLEDGTVKLMAAEFRMPCGFGEYNIVDVDDTDFPAYFTWNEMPTVSMADRPLFIEELRQEVIGLPENTEEAPSTYTPKWASHLLDLAGINPGIGAYVNPLIAAGGILGTYPKEVVSELEGVCDVTMQAPYREGLEAIALDAENIKKRIVARVTQAGEKVDAHIWNTRMGGVKLPKGIGTTKGSYFANLMEFCQAATREYRGWLKTFVVESREILDGVMALEGKLPKTVMHPTLGEVSLKILVRDTHKDWKAQYGSVPRGVGDKIVRQHFGHINRNSVNELHALSEADRHAFVLMMYIYIVKMGADDAYLFQTALNRDEQSTMDEFLVALYREGLAQMPNSDGSRRRLVATK